MRIARGNQVIGDWSLREVKRRIESGMLVTTDLCYDEELSDWLLLSVFLTRPEPQAKADKSAARPCYCGSGLPFLGCCGDGSQY